MIFTPSNAQGAQVYDVEARKRLHEVFQIDTDKGEVQAFRIPLRLAADFKNAESHTLRFRTIYPIFGGRTDPVLFHCYGRIE